MYNWYAVSSDKLCPSGWHVSDDKDWRLLIETLGGADLAGGKLKATSGPAWETPNHGATNSSGFTALPGGKTSNGEDFSEEGKYGYWWVNDERDSKNALYSKLSAFTSELYQSVEVMSEGYSVRCVRNK